MNTQFHKASAPALQSEKKGQTCEIIFRLDSGGFVIDASPNACELGIDLQSLLVMPHIADFAVGQYQQNVTQCFLDVVESDLPKRSIEFPILLRARQSDNPSPGDTGREEQQVQQWCSLTLRRLQCEDDRPLAVLGTMRLVQPKHATSVHMPGAAGHDPFTGLADRRSLVSSATSKIALQENGSLAVFAIDAMRAIFMQYGQGTADEVRWGFARFLESMVEAHQSLAQIDEERFGVILPGMCPSQARQWARDVLQIFAKLAVPIQGREPELSASAGIARLEVSAEWSLRQAELGLVMARSAGGMQAAICQSQSSLSSGHLVESAMEMVVEGASRRAR